MMYLKQAPRVRVVCNDLIRKGSLFLIILVISITVQTLVISTNAQSVGYHPNLNLGFNPFLSPVFGYGLGFPYGAYNFSPSRNPLIADTVLGASYMGGNTLAGKLHTKTIMKKLAWNPIVANPYYGSLKNKLFLQKHPEYAYTPDGLDYGYGKHYGATMLPNNPYKSAYGDYYNTNGIPASKPQSSSSSQQPYPARDNFLHLASNADADYAMAKMHGIIKPLVKAGVLVTTAALLSKKALESPMRLNPAGMILDGGQNYV